MVNEGLTSNADLFLLTIGKEAPEDSFVLVLCCDRRGDQKLELGCAIVDGEIR